MKQAVFILLLFGMVLVAANVLGQEKYEPLKVTGSETNNAVLIVSVQVAGARSELQCNADFPNCTKLQPGSYVMVRLPKNWGLYECTNVEVYKAPASAESEGEKLGDKLGQYCLTGK